MRVWVVRNNSGGCQPLHLVRLEDAIYVLTCVWLWGLVCYLIEHLICEILWLWICLELFNWFSLLVYCLSFSYSYLRMSYYWPTMNKDVIDFAKKCDACQRHASVSHQLYRSYSIRYRPLGLSWSGEWISWVSYLQRQDNMFTFWQWQIIFPSGSRRRHLKKSRTLKLYPLLGEISWADLESHLPLFATTAHGSLVKRWNLSVGVTTFSLWCRRHVILKLMDKKRLVTRWL